jgi:outer membrane receptor protein involved in Fe transport
MTRKGYKEKLIAALTALLVISMVFIIRPPVAKAQATTGTIRGVVTDPTGAVVPDADISAKEGSTGIEVKTRSNGEGIYLLSRVKPGVYLMSVQKQGYKRQEFQQVNVQIGTDTTIDAVLQPGQLTETVTVTATGEELIQKEQVQISNTFEERKVEDLPSNAAGGGIDTLALLAPGVVPGFGNVNSNGTTLSVNGNRARSNNFTIDGGDNNDLSIGGPSFFVDNQDTVAEFQVITSNFSAEYGRNQGAIVNIVTKTGTNQYHGTAAWFHRDNNFLNSMDNIEKRGGTQHGPNPDLFNIFEGTIGGPIKKDKLFFFGSFMYLTDFSTAIARSGSPTIAADQLAPLAAAFPNNPVINALTTASAFALNNFGTLTERTDFPQNATITIGGKSFRVAYPQRAFAVPFIEKEFSARGDYKINDKNAIWYRHFYQTASFANALGGSAGFTGNEPFSGNLASASWTSQLGANSVNELKFNWNRLSVIFGGGCSGINCIPDPGQILNTFTRISFSGIHSSDGGTLQTIGPATNLPQGRVVTSYEFGDNFSKVFGKHQLKFGADIHRLTNSVPFLPNVNGSYGFNSVTRILNNTPQSVQLAVGTVTINYTETDQFYYVQDDWKIKDNLTLNLGLRYENTGQPINILNQISTKRESDPSTAIWLQSLPLSARTVPKIPTDSNNFAPRLGFAWTPRMGDGKLARALFGEQDRTVISGGYSIAYDPSFYNIMLNVSTASPMVFLNTTVNPAAGPTIFGLPSGTATGSAVQALATSNHLIVTNTFDPRFFSRTIVAPSFREPYSEQWTLRVQREFSRNNVVEARYVGTHGVGLFETVNQNPRFDHLLNGFSAGGFNFPAFPNLVPQGLQPQVAGQGACVDNPATTTLNEANQCNGRLLAGSLVRSRENDAQSMYHSLQVQYRGRLFNQLSIGSSYTLSKALDNASEIFTFFETSEPQDPFSYRSERGYSGFDRRHAWTMNFIWDIPAFKDQKGWLGHALGGWQLNGIYYLTSGQRYTPSDFINTNLLGAGASYEDATSDLSFFGIDAFRPFVGNPSAPANAVGISGMDLLLTAASFGITDPKVLNSINPNGFYSMNAVNHSGSVVPVTKDQVAFIVNGPGAAKLFGTPFGNAGRGSLIGPRLNQMNLGLFKNIRIKERMTFQMRLETFNTLNHPNPGAGFIAGGRAPDRFVEDAGVRDGFNDKGGIEYARRAIQIGLKLIF